MPKPTIGLFDKFIQPLEKEVRIGLALQYMAFEKSGRLTEKEQSLEGAVQAFADRHFNGDWDTGTIDRLGRALYKSFAIEALGLKPELTTDADDAPAGPRI